MIGKVLQAVFGRRSDRVIKQVLPIVEAVNALEPSFVALSDEALRGKTDELKRRLAEGETLDDLLPEAFAACREASKRAMGQRHYDVQLIGGWALHHGVIAEMVTGEGKTLVATLAVYLNALAGKGVHLVTVNDYLARRDADWMRPVYEALGLTVGAIQAPMSNEERIPHYQADVTYGTNSEFGFDYLRDNMKVRKESQVQRGLHFAVVDEVDSILIDEARTPLIISGPAEDDRAKYEEADAVARRLKPGEDFEIKLKEHQCVLSDEGQEKAEKLAGVDFWRRARATGPTSSSSRCEPTTSTSSTRTTSSTTARSSSSTSSPAASWRAGAGPTGSTRPSRPRRGSVREPRTRRSRRSPTRTSSSSTTSSPA